MDASHKILIQEAEKAFNTADHLTYVSLPLLNEPKLMVTITQNIHRALSKGMQALLAYEYQSKHITVIPDNFQAQVLVFEQDIMPKYKINKEIATTLKEVRHIMNYQKESPIEFQRRENYILCDKDYKMEKLEAKRLKSYLLETRAFINFLRRLPC